MHTSSEPEAFPGISPKTLNEGWNPFIVLLDVVMVFLLTMHHSMFAMLTHASFPTSDVAAFCQV